MLNMRGSNISKFIVIIFLFIYSAVIAQLPPLSKGWETTKRGGIAFRVGGNKPLDELNEYSQLFTSRGYNFSFAMGLGESQFNDPLYIQGIKNLQTLGHKLFDITPNFRINYFKTKFDTLDYPASDSVDHNNGNKICLKYMDVDPSKKLFEEGTVDIYVDTILFKTGEEFTSFKKFDYLYFPSISKLVMITNIFAKNSSNVDSLSITDVWKDPIDLDTLLAIPYYYFDYKDIHMAPEALVLLGRETQKLADLYGIERPRRFITPGDGSTPWGITPAEIKSTLGDELGYISAQTYVDYSLKTYNEYDDPIGTRRFGMTWGQFKEEKWSLDYIKTKIADGIAKHYVLFNSSHFDGNYFTNTDDILEWCDTNNIPVLTATAWSNILYGSTPQEPFVNIFPPLNIDLDLNGIPDGYDSLKSLGTIETNDGPPGSGNVCYSIKSEERFCYISNLGGIEEGENDFEIWTKGESGSRITVYFTIDGVTQNFEFPANTTDWTKYDLSQTLNDNNSLIIPNTISKINISISCTNLISGNIKIGGMTLKAHNELPVELISFTANQSDLGVELNWKTATEVNNYGFEIERASFPQSTNNAELREWETIGFIEGHGNSYSPKTYSYVDSSNLDSEISYRLKQIDTDGKFEYSDIATISLTGSAEGITNVSNNLFQNHPNPFNPSTIISYQLEKSGSVSIKVYDILGNRVATLVDNEKQNAGNHSVEFNKFSNSNNLSSGIYFYQIIAGQYIDTKKMILLK